MVFETWEMGVQFLTGIKNFLFVNRASTGSGILSSSYPIGTGGAFSGSKGTGSVKLYFRFFKILIKLCLQK
jgi:hypothetical protein